jgi:hypothetical protein
MTNIFERAKKSVHNLSKAHIIQPILRDIEKGKEQVTYNGRRGVNFRKLKENIEIIAEAGASYHGLSADVLGADYGSDIIITGKNMKISGGTLKLLYKACKKLEKDMPNLFD